MEKSLLSALSQTLCSVSKSQAAPQFTADDNVKWFQAKNVHSHVFITFHDYVIVVAVSGNLYRIKSPNLTRNNHRVFSELSPENCASESQSRSKNKSKELLFVTLKDAWQVRISIKTQYNSIHVFINSLLRHF